MHVFRVKYPLKPAINFSSMKLRPEAGVVISLWKSCNLIFSKKAKNTNFCIVEIKDIFNNCFIIHITLEQLL